MLAANVALIQIIPGEDLVVTKMPNLIVIEGWKWWLFRDLLDSSIHQSLLEVISICLGISHFKFLSFRRLLPDSRMTSRAFGI